MKKFAFKTLSILLAAVLLAAALPLAAFAEDVSMCDIRPCSHNYQESTDTTHVYVSNEYHLTTEYAFLVCVWCGDSYTNETQNYEYHRFDDSVDEEVDIQGVCVDCKRMIYW